jgi:pimeloyl-ACP methyl ester carboxylesterase
MSDQSEHADRHPPVGTDRLLLLGNGDKTVVFLHGLFGTAEDWRSIMESLADGYRLFALQLPLDRQPERRSRGIKSLDELIEHVAQAIIALDLPPVVMCGNSLGGLVSIEMCLRHPDRVAGLVLVGSAGIYERSLTSGERPKPTREFVLSVARDIFAEEGRITGEMVEEWYQAVLDRDYVRFLLRISRATRDWRLTDELQRLELPTLIVWGRDDKVTPPTVAEEFNRKIAGSRLAYIEACGHAPSLERPAAVADLLGQFLPECFCRDPVLLGVPAVL